MKAKLLLTLFLVSLDLGAFASEHHKKDPRVYCKVQNRMATRAPFEPSMQAEDINDCLYITFQFSLDDVDITIWDKDGNKVVKEQQTIIYEGYTTVIQESDGYPYSVEIVSPTVTIQAKIILE